MKRFLRCENPSRCYLNATNQIMLAQCTILQSKRSSHTIWHLKKYAVFSTYCAVCRTLVLHYEHSEWNVSCDRLLMHIQDPLLGCMNRLHKHQRKKSGVGLDFVHWEFIMFLLFASCRNLIWVTGCWRAGIVPSSPQCTRHQRSVHCKGEVKLIVNIHFMVTKSCSHLIHNDKSEVNVLLIYCLVTTVVYIWSPGMP